MKNLSLLLLVFTVLTFSLGVEAKRKVLLKDIEPIPITNNSSIESVEQAIIIALLDKNWVPRSYEAEMPREILATLNVTPHSLTIKVRYDLQSISLSYEDSTNLRYLEEDGQRYIHDAYFAWTDWLVDEINTNLESSNYKGDFSQVCFRKLIEQDEVLPNNDFKLSRGRLASKVCSDEPLNIIVSDQRPYVLNGDKKRSFSGLRRYSTFGIPISFNAKEEYATTETVAEGLRLVLERAIPNSKATGILDSTSFDDFIKTNNNEDKLFLVELKEWKYDIPPKGLGKAAFHYNLDVSVRSKNNDAVIATHTVTGKRIIKSIKLIKEDHAWVYESIFNSPDIRKAILDSTSTPELQTPMSTSVVISSEPVEKIIKPKLSEDIPEKCSVAQVLKMNEMGLTNMQIEVACE